MAGLCGRHRPLCGRSGRGTWTRCPAFHALIHCPIKLPNEIQLPPQTGILQGSKISLSALLKDFSRLIPPFLTPERIWSLKFSNNARLELLIDVLDNIKTLEI